MDFSNPIQRTVFFEIHSDLPRESPGSDASTLKALDAVAHLLPDNPRIADLGCGPGSSAIPLARALPKAHITAIDLHAPFIDDVSLRAQAAGLTNITAQVGDMAEPPFTQGELDMIWCEGAIYNLGVEAGLKTWRKHLTKSGVIVFNEVIWQVPAAECSRELIDFWAEYPGMLDHDGILRAIDVAGYDLLAHFVMPESDWWDAYYSPMEHKLSVLEKKYAGNADALIPLTEARHEIAIRRTYADQYDCAFYCVRVG